MSDDVRVDSANIDSIVALFVRHLPSPQRAGQDLKALLRPLPEQLAASWPGVDYPVHDFIVNLAAAVPADQDPAAYLRTLHLTDLYLAEAASAFFPTAAETFLRVYLPEIERALRSWQLAGAQIDEVCQQLGQRLTCSTADGRRPALASYRGRGPLRAWLRITALREAQRLLDSAKRYTQLDDSAGLAEVGSADPELSLLKQRYRDAFERAFGAAMTTLDSRQRNILRYFYLEGLRTEEIGRLYNVHRVSVSRWLSDIREQLYEETISALRRELGAGDETIRSLVRMLQTQMDVRLSAYLLERRGDSDDASGSE